MKPLISPEKCLKHKYLYFICVSLLIDVICTLLDNLLSKDSFQVKDWLNDVFFLWGFMFLVAFFLFHLIEKKYTAKQSEKE